MCKRRATKNENRSWLLLGPKLLGRWSEGKLCLFSLEKKILWCDLVDDFQNHDRGDQGKFYQARMEQQGKGRWGMPKQAANILNNTTGRKQISCQVELLQLKGNRCGRCSHEKQLKQRLYMSSKAIWSYFKRREKFEDFCENQNLGIKMHCRTVGMPSQVRMPKLFILSHT